MLQDDAQKANAPTVLAPKQLPAHRHRHAGEMAPRGYPEGCVAHSSVPCQRNARGAGQAQTSSPDKNHVTSKSPVGDISVVTLIRTDTTLDHSQKAEKVWLIVGKSQLQHSKAIGLQVDKHYPLDSILLGR